MKKLQKGVLIVFEGIDGAGKSTQAEILLKKLQEQDYSVVYYREPSDSKWGRKIKRKAQFADSITPQEELELFQKDREANVNNNIRPSLERKEVIILDRYYFSTIAYQGAKGIDPESIRMRNEAFAVKPDLVFILDVEPNRGLERIADRRQKDILFEREEYLVKVRQTFRNLHGENIYHIDAAQTVEHIAEEIENITFKYLQSFTT